MLAVLACAAMCLPLSAWAAREAPAASRAHQQTARWVRPFEAASLDHVVRGDDGSIVVAGTCSGSPRLGCARVSCPGLATLFVTKLAPDGRCLWTRVSEPGSAWHQEPRALALGEGGQVLVTGHFTGRLDFRGGAIETPSGTRAGFALSLDAEGALRWVRSISTDAPEPVAEPRWAIDAAPGIFKAVAVSDQGEVCVASDVIVPVADPELRARGMTGIFNAALSLHTQPGRPRHTVQLGSGRASVTLSGVAYDREGDLVVVGRADAGASIGGFVARRPISFAAELAR